MSLSAGTEGSNATPKDGDGPDVSVVIPTHNRSGLLSLALRSALDQRGVRSEVLVVDDGSTDGTADAVAEAGDRRVRLVRHEAPLGVSAARNRGIEEARGTWVAFLDDDDLWAPDKLRLQLEALRSTDRVWGYAGAVHISTDHRVLGGAPPDSPEAVRAGVRRANLVPAGCSSVVVRKDSIPPGGFDGRFHHCADWDLWIRLAGVGLPASVPRPLVAYRVHAGNASVDTRGMLAELDIIQERYGGPVDRVAFHRHLARISLRMNRHGRAIAYYVRAAGRGRRDYVARAFIPDVTEAVQGLADRVRGRLGRPRRLPEIRRRRDPYAEWKAEARTWVEEFVRRHGA